MTAEKTPRRPAPPGLGRAGRRLWKQVVDVYEMRHDEAEALAAACRTLDELDRLEAELAAGPVVVKGSMGQPVANPLYAAVREHRRALAGLLAGVGLSEADTPGLSRSAAGRALARQRWDRGA